MGRQMNTRTSGGLWQISMDLILQGLQSSRRESSYLWKPKSLDLRFWCHVVQGVCCDSLSRCEQPRFLHQCRLLLDDYNYNPTSIAGAGTRCMSLLSSPP